MMPRVPCWCGNPTRATILRSIRHDSNRNPTAHVVQRVCRRCRAGWVGVEERKRVAKDAGASFSCEGCPDPEEADDMSP